MKPEDQRNFNAPDKSQVGKLARTGAIWSAMLIASRYVVRIGTTAVLARLLLPNDFGLLAMTVTLTTFLDLFSDMGLSWATIQEKELSREQSNNLFWVNVALGFGLWIVCIAAAPVVAWFYDRHELLWLTMIMGGLFIFHGAVAQPLALMKRQMRMRQIAIAQFSSHVIGAVTAVLMALGGWGYWSLVGQKMAAQLSTIFLIFWLSGYRIGRFQRNVGTVKLLKLGGFLTGYGVLNYFARNLDYILIGRVWGADELGYYNRAYFLMMLPTMLATGTLRNVMVPALAALKGDVERMGKAYRKAVQAIVLIACPLSLGLALTASDVIRLVYGEKWLAVAPILFWLSLTGVFQPIHNTMGWLFTVAGKGRAMFSWGLVATPVLAVGFLIGVQWGGVGVAIVYAILMTFVLTIPALYFAHRAAGISLSQTLQEVGPILATGFVMAGVVFVTGKVLTPLTDWRIVFAAKVVSGVLTYGGIGIMLIRPLPINRIEQLRNLLVSRIRRKTGSV